MFKIADFSRQTKDNPLKSDSDPVSKLWTLCQLYHPVHLIAGYVLQAGYLHVHILGLTHSSTSCAGCGTFWGFLR